MKKFLAILLCSALTFSLAACGCDSTRTEEAKVTEEGITLYATINIDGEIKNAYDSFTCTDTDGDGFVDVIEALTQMVSSFNVLREGAGVEKYFTYETNDDGATITKFYGIDGKDIGIFVDDEPISSPYDALLDGAHIYVFSYTDKEAHSDIYTFFKELSSEEGNHTLQLLGYKLNDNGSYEQVKIAGATIEYEDPDNESAEIVIYTTDDEGKVTLPYDDYSVVITAAHEEMNIVTPIFYSKVPQ